MAEKEQEKGPEIVSDQEKEIAQNALEEFKKKNYSACLQLLNKLESRSNDLKVVHNKAIVEYCKSDLKKTEQLQKSLTSICNQFQVKVDKLDDIDHCIIQYNQAVILYHQRQYTAAQRIMDRVYKFIEPMDEYLAKQVSLLAIEIQLSLRQPDKALTLISYLENNLIYGGSIPLKGLDKNGKERKITLPPPKPLSEEFEKKLLKYKIRCYLMNHSLSISSKEVQVLLKDKSNIDAMYLAANTEYLKGNYMDAVKILTSIPSECLCYSDCGESSTLMFYNNMGVLHHAMGKPNLACYYFQTALKGDISNSQSGSKKDDNEKPLYTLGSSKYHELMYNLGIALLHAGRPTQAFECLIVAVRRYHRNSRLWMRLAECCVMVHKETNEIDFEKQKNLIAEVVGSKEKQKIILVSNLSKDKKYSTESQSYAVPVPSLEFALLCLRNATLLIPSDTATPPVPLFLIPGVTPPAPPPSPSLSPSNPLSLDGIAVLRNSILVTSAYVSLCLGDYIMSLEHAKELLEQPRISSIHKLLAHLYAAESLVLLDKISEALEHLNPESIKDISFELPEDKEKPENITLKTNPPAKWFPNTLQSAQAVMQYNIAVAKTIRGQLDQAATMLRQIWQQKSATCQVPTHIIMLFIYIELQLGHTDVAKNLLRQYHQQQRISG
nr:CCR4-NOT transcription complex subunit 10 [Leptinotarsa decemlineata]